MKKIIACLLIFATLFGFCACQKKDNKKITSNTQSTANITQAQTTAYPAETEQPNDNNIYNYDKLESLLLENVFDHLGGEYRCPFHQNKLYFDSSSYNTRSVSYYDFSTGESGILATDRHNGTSGPPFTSNRCICVRVLSEQDIDPFEADPAQAEYHVYELENGELSTHKDTDEVLFAYAFNKVYTFDSSAFVIHVSDESGNVLHTYPVSQNFDRDGQLFIFENAVYALCSEMRSEDNTTTYSLDLLGESGSKTIIESAVNIICDDTNFYYLKKEESSYTFREHNIASGQMQIVQSMHFENPYYLYFKAGNRVYFSAYSEPGVSNLHIYYFDLVTKKITEIGARVPLMGGW